MEIHVKEEKRDICVKRKRDDEEYNDNWRK